MKKIIYAIFTLTLISACGENNSAPQRTSNEIQPTISNELKFDDTIFSYQKDNLPKSCNNESEIVCAIENVVKCALKPTEPYCDNKTMPYFIFYDDAMFADDNGLGRPTRQSFRLIKLKTIDNSTIEVFTEGTCDKNWFGNCQGNIIYVMSNKSGKWLVKELYALESI